MEAWQPMDDEQVGRPDVAAVAAMAVDDDAACGERRARIGRLSGLIWLVFLAFPVISLLQAHPLSVRPLVSLAAVAAFAVADGWVLLYARSRWRHSPQRLARAEWFVLVVLVVIPIGLVLAYIGESAGWLYLFIYTSTALAALLPERQAARAIIGLTVFVVALGLVTRADGFSVLYIGLLIPSVGYGILSSIRMTRTIRELRAAREEIARLAVSEERLRFARDLHDLLGHSLSLIVLKSELAGRLAAAAPDRAAVEIHDVEDVARSALREVREAVAGYRQPTLAEELGGAREMLGAAGIAYWIDAAPGGLPPATEAVLAWAVREGVTNVIRHSRAAHCTIHATRGEDSSAVEVIDDGCGASCEETGAGTGSGLRGLVERVAAQGGDFSAGLDAAGGYRLRVCVPLGGGRPNGFSETMTHRGGIEVGVRE